MAPPPAERGSKALRETVPPAPSPILLQQWLRSAPRIAAERQLQNQLYAGVCSKDVLCRLQAKILVANPSSKISTRLTMHRCHHTMIIRMSQEPLLDSWNDVLLGVLAFNFDRCPTSICVAGKEVDKVMMALPQSIDQLFQHLGDLLCPATEGKRKRELA